MDEIRLWLFIGKYRDTRQFGYLKGKSIQAMLLVAEKFIPITASSYPILMSCELGFDCPALGHSYQGILKVKTINRFLRQSSRICTNS